MIGQTISHYKILDKLGEGGMGVVYKAEDTKLDRVVALKFLPRRLMVDPDAKRRFINEAKATSALDHPNIATIYEIGEEDDQAYISMALIPGRSLKELVDEKTPSIDEVVDIAVQACQGLGAAHKRDVIHRDIKSDNIMITDEGVVKIMDFGLAKLGAASRMTAAGTTLGTIFYMSPEQAQGEEVDQRSDIFSLGVVLYELITGELPFKGEYEPAIIYSIITTDPDPLATKREDVPVEMQRIIDKALQKEVDKRYQSMDDLLQDLMALKEAPSGRVAKKPLPLPSRRVLIGAAVAALIIVAAVVVGPRIRFGGAGTAVPTGNSLAIMYFDNFVDRNDPQKFGEIITSLLITDLSESEYISVVSSQRLYDIIRLLSKEGSSGLEKDIATQVAEKAEARWMLTGNILQIEPQIIVTAHLVEVVTGRAIASQRITGGVDEKIFSIVDRLSAQLRKDLELGAGAQDELDRPVAEVTTHSEEAYRDYLEGMGHYYRHYWEEAENSFQRALEADSTLAMAYYRLSVMMVQKGDARARPMGLKAAEYIERAGARDRNYIESWSAMLSGDYGRGVGELEEMIERYPDEKEALFWLGAFHWKVFGQAEEAIEYLVRAIDLDPLYKEPYNILAYAYDRVGDFERSIWAINKYISLAPGEANPYDSRGVLYAYNGRLDQAIDSYKKALETKPGFYPSLRLLGHMYVFKGDYPNAEACYRELESHEEQAIRAEARTHLALIPMFQGKFREALEVLDNGIAEDQKEENPGKHEGDKLLLKSYIYREIGDDRSALAEMEGRIEALKDAYPGERMNCQAQYAEALAESGDMESAQAVADSLRAAVLRSDESLMFLYWRAQGAVEFSRGNGDSAIACLERAVELSSEPIFGSRYKLAEAFLGSNKLGDAVRELEAALSRYDEIRVRDPIYSVKAHYLIGLAYERSGWTEKAIEQYEAFLERWKDADPGIGAVQDANARLSRLRETS
jgi:serine/threonine protein kinase/tetratricopeptide (TPR) repeat protein